ncbi:MAG: bifunctional demethylmenaquinone methyltransferase/2-methoxy-6-polyprenyl-1,4-benzoquinol methylase UbiE [Spirochaetia bacterium]|jgi:demethylmenaquinone methyltransferase/2-methoxy-6-polyprenyl-1,4-benzoquinol methylase|nr:bifunctional demethylmenaquinone methyltransferase/2-methoxy-6-polyprenyl-1,4-benzoquinol methylase UbiE [Spirochaetia bacterium]
MRKENPDSIKDMFNKISPRYVLMNKLITFGQDRRWRRELIRLSGLKHGNRLLDVATGTGDVIIEALQMGIKLERSTGLDFSSGMLNIAHSRYENLSKQKRPNFTIVEWIEGDALKLPFKNTSFDIVTSAYLMRNAGDINTAFSEQYKVLNPGGKVACLDTTPPVKSNMSPFINFYLLKIIPILGSLISGNKSAYTYLPETTKAFKTAEEIKEIMIKTGFQKVSYRKYMFGTIAIHWGEKKRGKDE